MTSIRQKSVRFSLVVGMTLSCAGCGVKEGQGPPVSQMWTPMGTYATVSVPSSRKEKLAECVKVAKATFSELQKTLTVYDPESEVSRLNRATGKQPIPVSQHTRRMLELSIRYGQISNGAFDVTVCPLVNLWGFNNGTVPQAPVPEDVIQGVLRKIGYQHIVLSKETAFLELEGMSVDFGGIAKGYAVDVCFDSLMKANVGSVMVNLGGNLRCNGTARKGRPWNIGVQDPFRRDALVGMIKLTGGLAVATSGNYERFVMIGGKRFAHIVDPRTGRPVEGMAGVTVISARAVEADALSTSLYVAGVDGAKDILAKVPSSHALMIPDEKPIRIYVSPGFKRLFTPLPQYASAVLDL